MAKTKKKLVFRRQPLAELHEFVRTYGCDDAQRRYEAFVRALRRAKISAKTPISAGMIVKYSGLDALKWFAENRCEGDDWKVYMLAEDIHSEIQRTIDSLVADKLDDQLEG